jgi:hypothetical protein
MEDNVRKHGINEGYDTCGLIKWRARFVEADTENPCTEAGAAEIGRSKPIRTGSSLAGRSGCRRMWIH